jgi:hypothetical protein
VLDLASADNHRPRKSRDSIPTSGLAVVNHRGTSAAQGMRKLIAERPDLAAALEAWATPPLLDRADVAEQL